MFGEGRRPQHEAVRSTLDRGQTRVAGERPADPDPPPFEGRDPWIDEGLPDIR